MPFALRADTGTMTVSPPHSSGTSPCSASCCLTRSGLAPGRSILLMATMIGTLGRLGVVDRLDRLRHHAVVRRDDEHGDVGDLRAAGAHRGEGLVARRVEERDRLAVATRTWYAPMCWVMPPASPAATLRLADGVQQGRLAVVDVAHDGDDRRPGLQLLRRIAPDPRPWPPAGPGAAPPRSPAASATAAVVSKSSSSLTVTILPWLNRYLTMAVAWPPTLPASVRTAIGFGKLQLPFGAGLGGVRPCRRGEAATCGPPPAGPPGGGTCGPRPRLPPAPAAPPPPRSRPARRHPEPLSGPAPRACSRRIPLPAARPAPAAARPRAPCPGPGPPRRCSKDAHVVFHVVADGVSSSQ